MLTHYRKSPVILCIDGRHDLYLKQQLVLAFLCLSKDVANSSNKKVVIAFYLNVLKCCAAVKFSAVFWLYLPQNIFPTSDSHILSLQSWEKFVSTSQKFILSLAPSCSAELHPYGFPLTTFHHTATGYGISCEMNNGWMP